MKDNTQRGMFWVMATLSVAIFPQLVSMPPHLVALVVLPLIWRVAAELRDWKPFSMLLRVMITGMTVVILVITYGGLFGRRAAVSLLTLMLTLKLLESYKVRDARIVTSLSLFLCATQFLFSQGIFMLAYTAAVLISALMSMVLLQRREAYEPKGAAPQSGHSIFSELGYSSKLLAMAIPVALAMFVLFPRWGSPLWGVPEASLDAKSGLSGSMTPGSIQNLFMDDSPAFRADFDSPLPPQSSMYWRGPVFWDFDGTEWRTNYYGKNLPAAEQPPVTDSSWRYTVQMEPTERHWIFALDYPATLPSGVMVSMDYQLFYRRSITRLKSYDMVSNSEFVDSPELRNAHRISALNLPEGYNPRTLELVTQWREETPSDMEFVNRVLRHFNQENFYYTLNPPLLSLHTVDEFLFETRSGFCEHYASTFTVMMRMAGIPARVVTGYMGGWYNNIGNYVLVRQSDAHAWTEVWLPDKGWTRVDPTAAVAPGRIERGSLSGFDARRHMFDYQWLRNVRNGFDLVQRNWNRWIIAFNLKRQSNMFMPFGMGSMDAKRLVAIMVVIIAIIAVLMLPAILRFRLPAGLDPAGKQWQLFRKKLDTAGVKSTAAMTPAELNTMASDRLGDLAEEIDQISGMYRKIRYAPDAPGVAELESAVKGFQPGRKTA